MDDPEIQKLASTLVHPSYVRQGAESLRAYRGLVRQLLSERRAPEAGWEEADVERLLSELSAMDSNNLRGRAGVGEREGRVLSALVRRRHFGLAHGVGRSGDVAADQPKAAGSSLMARVLQAMVLDMLRDVFELRALQACVVLPVATGMSLALTLRAVADARDREVRAAASAAPAASSEEPRSEGGARAAAGPPRIVLWPRIDQQSCFKSILAAGLEPRIVALRRRPAPSGDELEVDVEDLERAVAELGAERVVCVMSTTSCFAPRASDPVHRIAKMCRALGVGHVINHAYGLQSRRLCALVETACRQGRVDAVVSSTDKNFLTPVGGAIVASPSRDFPAAVARQYPGRASATPALDLFITLLSAGKAKFRQLCAERERNFATLRDGLRALAAKHALHLLDTPNNPISLALAVPGDPPARATYLGTMLFARGVSGARVVPPADSKRIEATAFANWGAHTDDHARPYLTAAAAIGLSADEVALFLRKLDKVLDRFLRPPHAEPAGRLRDDDAGDDGEDRREPPASSAPTDGDAASSSPPHD